MSRAPQAKPPPIVRYAVRGRHGDGVVPLTPPFEYAVEASYSASADAKGSAVLVRPYAAPYRIGDAPQTETRLSPPSLCPAPKLRPRMMTSMMTSDVTSDDDL